MEEECLCKVSLPLMLVWERAIWLSIILLRFVFMTLLMDKNEQLQIILAENKGVIFLSLVDRIDRFK